MKRRNFVQLLAATPMATPMASLLESHPEAAEAPKTIGRLAIPKYRIVSPGKPLGATGLGMPGPYPGRVVIVKSDKCVDEATAKTHPETVREMMDRGICALTRKNNPADAWQTLFTPGDVVGIKVNCGGYPWVVSSPEIIVECIRNLTELGLKTSQIYIYERFQNQLDEVNYTPHLPAGVRILAAEHQNRNQDRIGYDPAIYVEADFFGEEDTRSNLFRDVSQTFTKIINIPNIKDHGAAGATGCLKNIAYGSFSNVARTHQRGRSNTYSFIGTLASVEPLRSKTVLQIMDGIRGTWHGGPFAPTRRFVFYPKQIMFGTDPVAIDRLITEIVEKKRREEGVISLYEREEKYLNTPGDFATNPNKNNFIREPEHIAYAAKLGLGVADRKLIRVEELELCGNC
ncbi:MAG: DUF362 domain-containing protein [Blastocatellia bacterium]